MKRQRSQGEHWCRSCGKFELAKGGNSGFKCSECRVFGGRHAASALVSKAIREGQLKRPAEFACVDCGARAWEYDHRDYNKPLAVEPVCRKCNLNRGPAIPVFACVEGKIGRGIAPYTSAKAFKKLCALMGVPELASGIGSRVSVSDWISAWPVMKAAQAKAEA